jgi:anti-sigma factor RsiW
MNCDEMQIAISAYVDDALQTAMQERMFGHLSTCSDCRLFLRRTLDLRATFAAIPAPDVPPSLDRRVMGMSLRRPRAERGAGERIRSLFGHRLSLPLPSAALIALGLITATVISLSLFQKPEVVFVPCLPTIDVYAVQPTNPTNSN